jgi:hypothetical protein
MKDERDTIIFLAIAFLIGSSILYVRDNNRKINLNIAGVDELISLPGIGSITAEKFIAKRVEMGSSPLLKTYC